MDSGCEWCLSRIKEEDGSSTAIMKKEALGLERRADFQKAI